MKIIKISIMLILLTTSYCFSGTITKIYNFEHPTLIFQKGYTRINIEEGYALGNPGNPEIPYIGIGLLLPQNEIVDDLAVNLGEEIYLGKYEIYPKQQQFPLSQTTNKFFTKPNSETYQKGNSFPELPYTKPSTHFLSGYSIGFLAITPIKYIPQSKKLFYYKTIEISIKTKYDIAAENSSDFLYNNEFIRTRIEKLVDNFEDIDNYSIPKTKDTDYYDYIIITSDDYIDNFQSLADFHQIRGFRTKIEDISDIYTNYSGVDNPDKIRNYLIDQYSLGPLKFVLLAGDTDIIPHRGLYVNAVYYVEDDIPADMYYSCLDRTSAPGTGPDWNNNNNSYWGEPGEDDLLAEFFIGRICMNNDSDVSNILNKINMYAESPVTSEVKTALLVGELLWADPTWGGWYMNELIGGCSNNGYTTVGIPTFWDITTLYEMNGDWTPQDLYDELNQGPNIVSHLGHGTVEKCLGIYNSDLTTSNITNNGLTHNFINAYSQACYSGSFDNRNQYGYYQSDCFMEKITTMPTATITFVGNSRYGFGVHNGTDGASQHFNRQWIDVFFDDGIYSIGGANQLSKEHTIPYIQSDPIIRWCCYELNVFGDPSTDLWTDTPSNMNPDYPLSIMAGTPQIDITAPPNSRITVYDDTTIYGYGTTDEFGSGTVEFDNIPTNSGLLNISLMAHNYFRYVGEITVVASVVYFSPDSINANTSTEVVVNVFAPDSITPEVGVDVWAEGLGYISDVSTTNANGSATLTIDYPYGPSLSFFGQKPNQDYYTFKEELAVIAQDLTDPSLSVTTNFGLVDTFALNLPGTISASALEDNITLWVNVDDSGFVNTGSTSYETTPITLTPISAIIAKSNYNIYQKVFPVIVAYGTISGIITNINTGDPISDVEIRFYESGVAPPEDPLFTATSNSSGEYEVTNEQPVDYYDIYIDKWGFNPYSEFNYFLGYGENNHNIQMDPVESGTISGQIYGILFPLSQGTITYYRSDNGEEFTSVSLSNHYYNVVLPQFTYDVYVTSPGCIPYNGLLTVEGDMEIDYHLGNPTIYTDLEVNDGNFTCNTSNGWQWGQPTAGGINAYSGINVWGTVLNGIYGVNNVDWTLDSPEITVPNNGILTFYHYHDFEEGMYLYDGGNVKISTNGGTNYELITPEEGYDGTISALNQQGFGGTIDDWEKVTFDLSTYTGEEVLLRWHFATDQGVNNYYGWYIDNVLVGDQSSSYQEIITSTDNNLTESTEFNLKQNYPNPVVNSTTIKFSIPKNTKDVSLKIYNVLGQLIKTYKPESKDISTSMEFTWDTKDEFDNPVSNGVYFYKLTNEKKEIIKRMTVVR